MDLSQAPQVLRFKSSSALLKREALPRSSISLGTGTGGGRPGAQGATFKEALILRGRLCTCKTLRVSASLNVVPRCPTGHSILPCCSARLTTWFGGPMMKGREVDSFTYWLTRVIKEDHSLLARDKTGKPWKMVHNFKIQIIWYHVIQKSIIWALRISAGTVTDTCSFRQS